MFSQTLRASRSSAIRCLRPRQPTFTRTFITPTAIRHADFVQDLYLRELKAYKPAPLKATDAEGQVKPWKAPSPPSPPAEVVATESLAGELAAYEAAEVEVEGQAAPGQADVVEDWFDEEEAFGGEEEEQAH